MFYVKGSIFLSSLSTPQASPNETSTTDPVTTHTSSTSSSVLHPPSDPTKCLDMIPICIIAAISLPAFAFLYTLLLLPSLLTATALAQQQLNNTNSGNNGTNTTFNVPLRLSCPPLLPRTKPATTVWDLRPDDIKVVAGLGDSVMAAFGAKGIQDNRFINIDTIKENRGVSFAMGGDPGEVTLPNIINYYSADLYGASVGDQLFTVCFGDQFCPPGQYKESVDILNAAQSGARSLNLDHELDYLLKRLDEAYDDNRIKKSDWKLLTLFIGSNDVCHACVVPSSLPQSYAVNVLAAVERIRLNIPNVLVQIVGILHVEEIFIATQAYPQYCQPFERSSFVLHNYECGCAHSETNRTIMKNLVPAYNAALQGVAAYYKDTRTENDTFAVIYQPLPADISTFPIQAISDVDCFHPSTLAHSWFSKQLWRFLFMTSSQKPTSLVFNSEDTIFCPTENDRFQLA